MKKTISILSLVLNCCLMGAVIFLAMATLDLKLSVSQLDEKMEMDTAKLANFSDWLEQMIGKERERFKGYGMALPKVTTGKTQLMNPDLPSTMENEKAMHDGILPRVENLGAVTMFQLDQKMSVLQLDHKTYMTTADPENIDGKLEQGMDHAKAFSGRFDEHNQSLYKVPAESTAPEVQSVLENKETMHDGTVQQLVKLEASCPSGYQRHREVCYKVFDSPKTFLGAASTCWADGGTLAMPRDAGINAFLISLAKAAGKTEGVWFGLHDRGQEGHWEWIDGTELGTGYRAWAKGEPNDNDGKQDCAWYWGTQNYQWDDSHCYSTNKFICEIKPSGAGGTSA
ncbi:C-type lectin domain family 4 member M-like [Branchiostoma lanceolatum]|uniref:C-type lectin domain family 4 member M-like n=1 Tax=Branchiostoma lanceolatum TaxID=7740 RepID=UPI003455D141